MTTSGTPDRSSTPRPHWTPADTLRRGRAAKRLFSMHAPELAPVMDPGYEDQLDADILKVSGETPAAVLGVQKTATAGKRDVAADAHDLVMLIRDVVVGARASSELRTAIGVGDEVHAHNASLIADHLRAIGIATSSSRSACRAMRSTRPSRSSRR